MEEPYESTKRPEFPRQIRYITDLHVGDYVFDINLVGKVSVQLYKILALPCGGWVRCALILDEKRIFEVKKSLQDYSILPYPHGEWNRCNFLISARKQRTPLTEKEKQALIKELGVTPFPSKSIYDEYTIRFV